MEAPRKKAAGSDGVITKSTEPKKELKIKKSHDEQKKAPESRESTSWQSAMSFDAPSTSTLLRKVLEGMDIDFKRERSERSYSQLYAILPFPRVAYVFRFNITRPAPLIIDIYETNPATYGPLGFIEIPDLNDDNIGLARQVLRALVKELPRPPWKFTAAQRFQHSLMNPDLLRAPKNWRAIGIAD